MSENQGPMLQQLPTFRQTEIKPAHRLLLPVNLNPSRLAFFHIFNSVHLALTLVWTDESVS